MNLLLIPFFALTLALPEAVMAYEQPNYEVRRSEPGFEVRSYAPYWVVETEVQGDFESSRNAAFRRLFDYISGNNRAQQKIEMTVPVITRPSGEKIEMTAPVVTRSNEGGAGQIMQFVLPSRFTEQTAPQPVDSQLQLRRVDAQWTAARTYSGRSNEDNYRQNEAELLRDLQAAGFVATGAPRFAVYNGPFTPWFMRRNEVIVPIAAPPP